jgi:hypothetical protein
MGYVNILRRAWNLVWRYRALWIFGMLLALTTVGGFYFVGDLDAEDNDNWGIRVKLTEDAIIYLPGEGLRVDLTRPGDSYVEVLGGSGWRELGELRDELAELADLFVWEPWGETLPAEVWAVLIALGAVLALTILMGGIARYVSEASLIRMVSHTEEADETVGLRCGFSLGFSRTAWRLFLIDLFLQVPVKAALILLFVLALLPLGLWALGSTAAGVVGTLFATGLFFLMVALSLVVSAALSLLLQVCRRACAVEGLGTFAAIRRGTAMVRSNPKQVVSVWAIWIATRLVWMVAMVPLVIVLSPIILMFLVIGTVLAGVPAVLIGAVLSSFFANPAPWVIGAIVGLPILFLVTLLPTLFCSGLVEVFKSSTWTLGYRQLLAMESSAPVPVPAPGAPGLEPAPAA